MIKERTKVKKKKKNNNNQQPPVLYIPNGTKLLKDIINTFTFMPFMHNLLVVALD